MQEQELIVLVGLPASGKGTWVEQYMQDNANAVWLSSDKIREELSGDEAQQLMPEATSVAQSHSMVFEIMQKRAKEALKNGQTVIYDATNISAKRRINLLKQMKKHYVAATAVYFNTPFRTCVNRDEARDRTVGIEVIAKMHNALQVPTYSEGWDLIKFVNNSVSFCDWTRYVDSELSSFKLSHDELFDTISFIAKEFKPCINLAQDNPHHAFSVSRHIYHVMEYVHENYERVFGTSAGKEEMMLTALFHDVGKGYTKTFDGRYARFIGHENVSAQIASVVLQRWGYDIDTTLRIVELVQYHMRLMQLKGASNKSVEKFKQLIGEDKFFKLDFFYQADTSAK